MPIVFEGKAGGLEFAGAFDIDPVKPVDQDIGDAGIFEKGFQRAKTEDLIQNLAGQALAFGKAERDRFTVDRSANEDEDFLARRFAVGATEFLKIETDLAMEVGFDLLVFTSLECLQVGHSVSKPS